MDLELEELEPKFPGQEAGRTTYPVRDVGPFVEGSPWYAELTMASRDSIPVLRIWHGDEVTDLGPADVFSVDPMTRWTAWQIVGAWARLPRSPDEARAAARFLAQ